MSIAVQELTKTLIEMREQLQLYGSNESTLEQVSNHLDKLMTTSAQLIEKITTDLSEADQIIAAMREKNEQAGFSLGRFFGRSDSDK